MFDHKRHSIDEYFNDDRFVRSLAQSRMTTFGNTVDNFICCTKEGSETNPHIVVRNVRQFMNGIKNYLCQNGEADLNRVIEQERNNVRSTVVR